MKKYVVATLCMFLFVGAFGLGLFGAPNTPTRVQQLRAEMLDKKLKEKGVKRVAADIADDVYYVIEGDTGIELTKEFQNSSEWQMLLAKNPYLNDPKRIIHRNGRTILLIYPGEEIRGLKKGSTLKFEHAEAPQETGNQKIASNGNAGGGNQTLATSLSDYLIIGLLTFFLLVVTGALYLIGRNILEGKGVAFSGLPMRSKLKRFLRLSPSLTESLTTFERMRTTDDGSLAEIYQTRLFSFLPISTEFANGVKPRRYDGDPVYIGVFRNKKSEIIDVVLFAKYCLNGIPFDRMESERVRVIFKDSLRFESAKRIATPSGYQGAENFGSVETWLRNKYETATTNQETQPTNVVSETPPTPETTPEILEVVEPNVTQKDVQELEKVLDKLDGAIEKIEETLLGDINQNPPSTTKEERKGFHLVGIEPIRTHAVTASVDCTETINKKTGEKMVGLMINDTTLDLHGEIEKGSFIIRDKNDKRILIEFSNDGVRMTPVAEPKRKTEKQRKKDAQNYIGQLMGEN